MRPFQLLASVVAMALSASHAAAQRYEIPDRLAYLNLPADPAEFIRMAVNHERNLTSLHNFGCPSEVEGYAGAVFDMLFEAAATDFEVRRALASGGGSPSMDCEADFARWKTWFLDLYEREYRAGLYNTGNTTTRPAIIGGLPLLLREDASHHNLVREIARDGEVSDAVRVQAVEAMVAHRVQAGTPKLEAERDVMLDMATAPAIVWGHNWDFDWEWDFVKRLSEHFEDFWCEYNRLAYESRVPDPDLLARRDTIGVGAPRIDPKPCQR